LRPNANISLGKRGQVDADVCSIDGMVRLGNSNSLRGHFFGDRIRSDHGNVGHCCSADTPSSVAGAFTETADFYRRHPAVVQSVLTGAGGSIAVGGRSLTNMDIDNGHSLVEALCLPSTPTRACSSFRSSPRRRSRRRRRRHLPDLALCTASHQRRGDARAVDDRVNSPRLQLQRRADRSPFEPSGPGDPVLLARRRHRQPAVTRSSPPRAVP
jgi:hypothetical protein